MEHDDLSQRIQQLVDDIQAQLALLQQLVAEYVPTEQSQSMRARAAEYGSVGESRQGAVVEGVFDGQNMVGPDGKIYTVPANYASKSKLVEGDMMKLTITDDGSFIYKQIGPVERARAVGTLVRDDSGNWRGVMDGGRSFRLLTASVTYFRGQAGDQVVMLVPEAMDSRWAAVEHVVPAGQVDGEEAPELPLDDTIEIGGPSGELGSGSEMQLDDGVASDDE